MLKKIHIWAIVGLSTAIWIVVLMSRGIHVSLSEIGSFSTVVGGTYFFVWLFDRYIWPCRLRGRCLFHGWLLACPDIRGTWEVELLSSWDGPGATGGPIRGYYGVRQTSSTLQMHFMTGESESFLLVHRFSPSSRSHGYKLTATYCNEPNVFLRGERSEIHYGAIILELHGDDVARPDSFSGEYWTDRGTKGTMKGRRTSRHVASTREQAERLCLPAEGRAGANTHA